MQIAQHSKPIVFSICKFLSIRISMLDINNFTNKNTRSKLVGRYLNFVCLFKYFNAYSLTEQCCFKDFIANPEKLKG